MQELDNIFQILTGPGSQAMSQVGLGGLVVLLALSLASSFFIAWLYRHFYASRATGSEAHRAFPLLGVSITAIFIAIQFSLPLSLGLLGALSIVRFRTPIKEPEEIGFIMLVIAAALACATFKLAFLGVLLLVVPGALVVQRLATRLMAGAASGGLIVVAVPPADGDGVSAEIAELLRARLAEGKLESLSRSDESTVISYAFREQPASALLEVQAAVQEKSAGSTVSIFFNRATAV